MNCRQFSMGMASLFLAGWLIACGTHVRKFTYGPDFKYLTTNDISSAMFSMANTVRQLDAVLADATMKDKEKQNAVERLLKEMEERARAIETTAKATNHPIFGSHLDKFMFDLSRAQNAAMSTPANYYWAGRITGSCTGCHVQTR